MTTTNRHRLAAVLLCLGLTVAIGAQAETRRAVVVGIDQYVIPGAPLVGRGDPPDPRFWSNLDGAVNDADRMSELLVAKFGFEHDGIVDLRNQDAKRAAILAAIEDHLIDKTEAGDVAFFYYAGHGSRVRNSLSPEADKLDESLVPADAATGARDIRDKELRDLINRIIDRGGIATVVLDSCHSGSATRGPAGPSRAKTRMLPIDPRDVRDGSRATDPWERGALVFSATQKDQEAYEDEDEFGNEGGLFTLALTRALRTSSPDEPAQNLFRRVHASLRASGRSQDPGLEGTDARKGQSLFGGSGAGLTGRSVASVQSVSGRTVTLQEGLAAGLTVATELVKVKAPDEGDQPEVRIVVADVVDLVTSRAEVKSGSSQSIHPGDLFVVDKWAPPDVPNLRVWIPSTNMSKSDLIAFGTELAQAVTARGHTWVIDPTDPVPTDIVRFNGSEWEFIGAGADPVTLGPSPDAASIAAWLPAAGSRNAAVYLNLPAPASFSRVIQLGEDTDNNAIALSGNESRADYHLIGRLDRGQLSYAWVRPWVSSAADSTMPWITDWIALSGPTDAAAAKLETLAVKLGHLNAWLRLEGPPGSSDFPYRLVVKADQEDRFLTEGSVGSGELYALALKADLSPTTSAAWRYVYVFAMDSHGKSTLLYPLGGATQNRFPPEEDAEDPQSVYVLPRSEFRISPPFGVDTFVMIAAKSQLPDPSVLSSSGVRSASRTRGGGGYGLADLLGSVGARTRGTEPQAAPTEWSIQRISLTTTP